MEGEALVSGFATVVWCEHPEVPGVGVEIRAFVMLMLTTLSGTFYFPCRNTPRQAGPAEKGEQRHDSDTRAH